VEVAPDQINRYKVGNSRPWRLAKSVLGLYLPYRFTRGRPFHAGVPWQVMEVGLKVMSSLLAK